ncbi:hypothetical protein APHAL10511_005363 [Amanita phalloides]|nr:hypothetical protein APHAL10511_005363 [Amanita phalloides]
MAPIRISTTSLQRRRRSSFALHHPFMPAKPGIYGTNRPVTFAPNVTPGTYVEPEASPDTSSPDCPSLTPTLFPPSEAPSVTRKRCPPGKRPSQGYIPRPPNAFMLFRADFVRQKHVPGSIETNHGSLSKIIGNCWRALPLEEKRVWEVKAKHAKAEHKIRYPNYRFRPVHNKNKDKKKGKQQATVDDERRCEEVAQLLLEGKKGDELAAAIRHLDRLRSETPAEPALRPRRPSSVPLPNDYFSYFSNIALPSLPLFPTSRPSSPVAISHHQRKALGARRSSSAGPAIMSRSWTMAAPTMIQDNMPLPEVDTSLFNPSWSNAFPVSVNVDHNHFNFNDVMHGLSELQSPVSHDQSALGPLDPSPLHMMPHTVLPDTAPELDVSWMSAGIDVPFEPFSKSSSAYSGSPEPTENVLHAPQPQQRAVVDMMMYSESLIDASVSFNAMNGQNLGFDFSGNNGLCGLPLDPTTYQGFPAGLDPSFDAQSYDHHNALYEYNPIVAHE